MMRGSRARRRAVIAHHQRAMTAALEARLAARKVDRPGYRARSLKSARTRLRHDVSRDPLLSEQVAL